MARGSGIGSLAFALERRAFRRARRHETAALRREVERRRLLRLPRAGPLASAAP